MQACVYSIAPCVDCYELSVCVPGCRLIHRSILLWFPKLPWVWDQHKFKAPKIATWSHPFHQTWPPSNSKPAPHTVSITRALRITPWHKTRVCPVHYWAFRACCSAARKYGAVQVDLGGFGSVAVTELCLCSESEGWKYGVRDSKGFSWPLLATSSN